jgi:SAM-dependent methyltransferase
MDNKAHWEGMYRNTEPDRASWYQVEPEPSLQLIRQAVPETAAIIDVGGGTSTLVDSLVSAGYLRVTVLDLSPAALAAAQRRLGEAAGAITWIEGDLLNAALPAAGFDLWHDRALFHFLTKAPDRQRYVRQVRRALSPDGYVLIATFAPDGPERCSGLEVVRYSAEGLRQELGAGFTLDTSVRVEHRTPAGLIQPFIYCLFHRDAAVGH